MRQKRQMIKGFYMNGYEFLPGDYVWVDTYDGHTNKGTIMDLFCWDDYDRQVIGVELITDDGEYLALDDYLIRNVEYVIEENGKEVTT